MLSGHLLNKLLLTALLALACMVLWGGVDLSMTWRIVGLLIAFRLIGLFKEWTRKQPTASQWVEIETNVAREVLAEHPQWTIDQVLASPEYRETVHGLHTQARPADRRDIALEALSLFVVIPSGMLLPLMLTSPIVSFSGVARWSIILSLASGIGLHFLPSLIDRNKPLPRIYCRMAVSGIMVAITGGVLLFKHDYLIKTGPEKRRIIAEKVWNLGQSIPASRHAGALFAYADDLAAEGRLADAVTVYERGLSLDPHNLPARQKLSVISANRGIPADSRAEILPGQNSQSRSTTLWVRPENVTPAARLPQPPPSAFSIVLVPVGDVPAGLIDRLAAELKARSELPVYRYESPVSLPPPDRTLGLIGPRQWHPKSIAASFLETRPPRGAQQYIVVTPADLFVDGSNYVFGTTAGFHGFTSYARFHSSDLPPAEDDLLIDRLAKQVLSTSIKGFGIVSTTTDCVTTFCRDLREFDLKSQVPSPQTRKEYHDAIRALVAKPQAGPAVY
ncbi:MAG TPA: tetratricopeptide repeat protein [Rariglobus sp.]